ITRDRARVLPVFHDVLKTPGAGGRLYAVRFVREHAADAREVIPTLLGIARDPDEDPYLVPEAAFTLWKLTKHEEAIPILLRRLKEGPADLEGAEELAEIGPPAKAAIPILVEKLKTFSIRLGTFTQMMREVSVKRRAAQCLGRFGPDAKEAGEVLRRL